eukprot:1018420-Pyramimonas_sp.AAC.1
MSAASLQHLRPTDGVASGGGPFDIARRVTQTDDMSSIVFNSRLDGAIRRRCGGGGAETLSHMRRADNIL